MSPFLSLPLLGQQLTGKQSTAASYRTTELQLAFTALSAKSKMLGLENVSLEKRSKIGAGQKVDRGTRLNLILCMQEKVRSDFTNQREKRRSSVPVVDETKRDISDRIPAHFSD